MEFHRRGRFDATITLHDGRGFGVVRQGLALRRRSLYDRLRAIAEYDYTRRPDTVLILVPSVWEERLTMRFCEDRNIRDCYVAVESRNALERRDLRLWCCTSWVIGSRCSPRPMRTVQRARFMGYHLDGQPGGVGGEAARGEMVEADAVLQVSDGILNLGVAAMVGLQFQGFPVPVGDEAVIAVGGEEGQLGTGRRLHPPHDEPHRGGVGLYSGRGCRWFRLRRRRRPSSRDRRPVRLGYGLDQVPKADVLADGDGEADIHLAADRDQGVGIEAAVGRTVSCPLVDNGRSLREDVKALTNHSGSQNYVDIPVYLKGRDGEGDGIGRRQCTDNYKIRPIRKKIRDLLGLKPRQRVPSGVTVELWLGISTDEAIRMKTSRDRWITNRYPLIEAAMSRQDCIDWWAAHYDRPLERSACVACPFQSRQRWVETKRRWPDLFAEAVQIDANLRDSNRGLALDKTPYLHMLRMPLAEAVSLDEAEMGPDGQRDGFGNECEGHCGV